MIIHSSADASSKYISDGSNIVVFMSDYLHTAPEEYEIHEAFFGHAFLVGPQLCNTISTNMATLAIRRFFKIKKGEYIFAFDQSRARFAPVSSGSFSLRSKKTGKIYLPIIEYNDVAIAGWYDMFLELRLLKSYNTLLEYDEGIVCE